MTSEADPALDVGGVEGPVSTSLDFEIGADSKGLLDDWSKR